MLQVFQMPTVRIHFLQNFKSEVLPSTCRDKQKRGWGRCPKRRAAVEPGKPGETGVSSLSVRAQDTQAELAAQWSFDKHRGV